jgi:AraC-like DNA-binding protein
MNALLNEIIALTHNATTEPTFCAVPGVVIVKGEVPAHQLADVYVPMIGFTVQGRKTIAIGDQVIDLRGPSYFVISTDVPATGRVYTDSPYLSVGLALNKSVLMDLMSGSQGGPRTGVFAAAPATSDFVDAWARLLRLMQTPEHISALAPVYEREILYRVLSGPQGWRLRQVCESPGRGTSIHRAIVWLRSHYAKAISIDTLAAKSAMAVTTFHRQFKRITGLSPLQFQKHLRLLEARKRLVHSSLPVSQVAFEVGYESASQFNREYARFFGTPPARDTRSGKNPDAPGRKSRRESIPV